MSPARIVHTAPQPRVDAEAEYARSLSDAFLAALGRDSPSDSPDRRAMRIYSRTVTSAQLPLLPPDVMERIRFEVLGHALTHLGLPVPRTQGVAESESSKPKGKPVPTRVERRNVKRAGRQRYQQRLIESEILWRQCATSTTAEPSTATATASARSTNARRAAMDHGSTRCSA